MKNYTITEEQIKKLDNEGLFYVRDWFPEAFTPELELNKWYKWKGHKKTIGYVDRSTTGDCYSFKFTVNGICDKNDFNSLHYSNLELATEDEVRIALINEAKKRGFKEDVEFISVITKSTHLCDSIFEYFPDENALFSYNGGSIFKNGIWAEIKKEPVILNFKEIADKFGIDVDQLRITRL